MLKIDISRNHPSQLFTILTVYTRLQIASHKLMWHSCGSFCMVLFLKSSIDYEWGASVYNNSIVLRCWRRYNNIIFQKLKSNYIFKIKLIWCIYYSSAICKTCMEMTNFIVFWTQNISDILYRRDDFCRILQIFTGINFVE